MFYQAVGAFFPDRVISHIKKRHQLNFCGGPGFEAHLEILKIIPTFFRWEVHFLEILPIVHLPDGRGGPRIILVCFYVREGM